MFSWIIEQKATILDIKNWVFEVENTFGEIPTIWQSIAHDWACMTITNATLEKYSFFAMQESLSVTNFHTKKIWDYFNVERSLKVWDRIDWHFVTWHIDTVWNIDKIIINDDKSKIIYTKFDEKYTNFIIKKWSITINWVSLTIVDAWNDYLSVSLIPLTQEITNLWILKVWDIVNLEFDMMWKYISKMMWE
jgi:riboflavin synthase